MSKRIFVSTMPTFADGRQFEGTKLVNQMTVFARGKDDEYVKVPLNSLAIIDYVKQSGDVYAIYQSFSKRTDPIIGSDHFMIPVRPVTGGSTPNTWSDFTTDFLYQGVKPIEYAPPRSPVVASGSSLPELRKAQTAAYKIVDDWKSKAIMKATAYAKSLLTAPQLGFNVNKNGKHPMAIFVMVDASSTTSKDDFSHVGLTLGDKGVTISDLLFCTLAKIEEIYTAKRDEVTLKYAPYIADATGATLENILKQLPTVKWGRSSETRAGYPVLWKELQFRLSNVSSFSADPIILVDDDSLVSLEGDYPPIEQMSEATFNKILTLFASNSASSLLTMITQSSPEYKKINEMLSGQLHRALGEALITRLTQLYKSAIWLPTVAESAAVWDHYPTAFKSQKPFSIQKTNGKEVKTYKKLKTVFASAPGHTRGTLIITTPVGLMMSDKLDTAGIPITKVMENKKEQVLTPLLASLRASYAKNPAGIAAITSYDKEMLLVMDDMMLKLAAGEVVMGYFGIMGNSIYAATARSLGFNVLFLKVGPVLKNGAVAFDKIGLDPKSPKNVATTAWNFSAQLEEAVATGKLMPVFCQSLKFNEINILLKKSSVTYHGTGNKS